MHRVICLIMLGAILNLVSCASTSTKVKKEAYIPTFHYKPQSSAAPGEAGLTFAIIGAKYAEEQPWTRYSPFTDFSKNLDLDFQEVISARGYTQRGPFRSYDEMTLPDKNSCDLVLQPILELSVKENLYYDKIFLRASYKLKGSVTIGGRVTLTLSESLSNERIWFKSIELTDRWVPIVGETIYPGHKLGLETPSDYTNVVNATDANIDWSDPDVIDALGKPLEEIYSKVMQIVWDYLDPKEMTLVKKQADEIKKKALEFEASIQTKWIELRSPGEEKYNFKLGSDKNLWYRGKSISNLQISPTAYGVLVSPPSPDGRYFVVVTSDDLQSKLYLIQVNGLKAILVPLEGPPMAWLSWAPTTSYVVVGSYYEADEKIYSVDLSSYRAQKVAVNLAKFEEQESFDLDKLTWLTNGNRFVIRVDVYCNPYTDRSHRCDDKKVLHSYEVTVDVATHQVDAMLIRRESPPKSSPRVVVMDFLEAVNRADTAFIKKFLDMEMFTHEKLKQLPDTERVKVFTTVKEQLWSNFLGSGATRLKWQNKMIVVGEEAVQRDSALVEVTFVDKKTGFTEHTKAKLFKKGDRWWIYYIKD
jgi:hypothetical protein